MDSCKFRDGFVASVNFQLTNYPTHLCCPLRTSNYSVVGVDDARVMLPNFKGAPSIKRNQCYVYGVFAASSISIYQQTTVQNLRSVERLYIARNIYYCIQEQWLYKRYFCMTLILYMFVVCVASFMFYSERFSPWIL